MSWKLLFTRVKCIITHYSLIISRHVRASSTSSSWDGFLDLRTGVGRSNSSFSINLQLLPINHVVSSLILVRGPRVPSSWSFAGDQIGQHQMAFPISVFSACSRTYSPLLILDLLTGSCKSGPLFILISLPARQRYDTSLQSVACTVESVAWPSYVSGGHNISTRIGAFGTF